MDQNVPAGRLFITVQLDTTSRGFESKKSHKVKTTRRESIQT